MFTIEEYKKKYNSGAYQIKMEKPTMNFMRKSRNGDPYIETLIETHNKMLQSHMTAYRIEKKTLHNLRFTEMLEALCNEYNWTCDQAKAAYGFVRSNNEGILEVLDKIVDYFSFKKK